MRISKQVDLKPHTSLRVGGPAETLVVLEANDNLAEVVMRLSSGPVSILGYGTNCLISDRGLPGSVILNRTGRVELLGPTTVKADSGADWDELIKTLINKNLWGLEFTSGIPGGVGAAIAGNIAAYGHKVADRCVEATILDSTSGAISTWKASQLQFDYRSSALQAANHKHLVVLDACFELSPEPTGELSYDSARQIATEVGLTPDSLVHRRAIIMETRRRAGSLLTDEPGDHHTAGSFFKNPLVGEEQVQKILSFEEHGISREQLLRQNVVHSGQQARVSAALILLAAGFKRGQSWGQVRLHPDHILKIENMGQATAQDIYNVVQEILAAVKDKLDIELEPEVRFLGEF